MKTAVLRMVDDQQDVHVNPEHVVLAFATALKDADGKMALSSMQTSINLITGMTINVEGGLERVVGMLRAAR